MEAPLPQPKTVRPKTAPLKTSPRRKTPATYEDLSRRLVVLADDALRLGYPFTAEHLMHLAQFVIQGEKLASAGIARSDAGTGQQVLS
jgi:hypothetical protein